MDYAFGIDRDGALARIIPEFQNNKYHNCQHTEDIDIAFLRMALKDERIKIYSISPTSSLCEVVPLAKHYKTHSHKIELKERGYICDILLPIKKQKTFKRIFRDNLKKLKNTHGINNIFYIFFSDLFCIFKSFFQSFKR